MNRYGMPRADPTDVMGRRIGAYVIDSLIAIVIIIGVFSSAVETVPGVDRSAFCKSYNAAHPNGICVSSGGSAYLLTPSRMDRIVRVSWAAALGWTTLNAVLLQGLVGATIGKLLLGLRVVRPDGRLAGFGWCALRTLVLVLVDALCFIIGLVVALSSNGHRRVGDMAASTFVVSKDDAGHPIVIPGLTTPWASSGSNGAPSGFRPGPPGEGPTWDPARGAYIQYDRARSAWIEWDDASRIWKPIDQA